VFLLACRFCKLRCVFGMNIDAQVSVCVGCYLLVYLIRQRLSSVGGVDCEYIPFSWSGITD